MKKDILKNKIIFKKYKTISRIGKGSFGYVYSAKNINDNTKVTQENFKDFDKEKIKVSSFDFDRKLTKVTSTFNKIWQDYPVELEKEEFRKLMTDLKINDLSLTYFQII